MVQDALMICDVCLQNKSGITWSSGGRGTVVVCPDCGRDLEQQLDSINERLAECDDLSILVGQILSLALHFTAADMGNIQLVDADGVLRIHASSGLSEEFLTFFSSVKESQAACGTALANRSTVVVEDVEHSDIFAGKPSLAVMLAAGARAVQSTPIITQSGRLIGVFSTHYREPRAISVQESRSLEFLALRAADLIDALQAVGRT
ncbi:MAG: GAF domain-containing protein [Candidatus Eremiobacteraeota bacterium]|nr:GAF domain-containing protein [Candidatus Eremiobacteraeota bacterium]